MSYKVTDKNRIPEYIEMLRELGSGVIEIGIFRIPRNMMMERQFTHSECSRIRL